jgi:large subunit ribosomal protein L3
MNIGIIGRKRGMTRVFQEDGTSVPVTVVEATPNRIAQLKTTDHDGYAAVQVTVGERKPNRLSKPLAGHFAKHGVSPGEGCWELRVDDTADLEVGGELTVTQFEPGQKVLVTGISKGKGFAGTVKRHNFRTQDATHGNSLSHRAPGSIGQCQTPGRVFKGKKMAGHMGSEKSTVKNLEVVSVDADRGLLLLKGAVPGSRNGHVVVRFAGQSN